MTSVKWDIRRLSGDLFISSSGKLTICELENHYLYRRKFRSQTSDNMDRWKAEQGRGREKRKIGREKIRRKKSKKKEDADAWKGRKVAKHCVFPMIWGSGGSKSRLAKAAGAEPAGQMRDEKLHAVVARSTFASQNVQNMVLGALLEVEMLKKCTPLWHEAHFQVKMHKTHQVRTTFGTWDVEKVHAVVAKRISKSKCTKHTRCGPLLALEMSKKCTPLWREAHFQVKMLKTPWLRNSFGGSDVEKVHVVVARSTFASQNVKKHHGFGTLLEVQMSKKCTPLWREAHFEVKMLKAPGVRTTFGGSDVASLRFASLHYTTLDYTTTTTTQLHNYTPLHYNYNYTTTLHYTPLHSTTLDYTTLPSTTLHYITLHYTTLHYNYNYNCTPLHSTTLPYTKLHYTTLHSTTLHYTTLHYLPLHFTTLHYTPLHYNYNYNYTTTLHYTPLH